MAFGHLCRVGVVRKVTVALPGACGELVQGTLNGVRCLVSCPIDRTAELEAAVTQGGRRVAAPTTMPKTRRALQLALTALDRGDGDVRVERRRGLYRVIGGGPRYIERAYPCCGR